MFLHSYQDTKGMHHFQPPRKSPLAGERLSSKKRKPSLPPDLLHRLKTFPLFSDAPHTFFQALAASLRLVQFRPQEYIVKQGEPSKAMYWILRGSVGVTSTDGEAIYAELTAGSFFGEIGILFNRPRTATVVARTKVLLGVLTKDALSIVLEDYPKFERIIRDEGQERLAMQEKRKRLSKLNLPSLSQRRSIVPPPLPSEIRGNKNLNSISGSLLANDHDQIPGPALPPMTMDPLISLNEQYSAIDTIDNSISTREFLCNLSIFKSLPNDVLHDLALAVEIHRYRPMEYVFEEGEFGRDIFFIIHGEVEVIKQHAVMARLSSMNYFGEFAFLSSLNGNHLEPRSASIRTINDCEMLILHDKTLDSICQKYPSIMESMKQTAFERTKSNSSRAASLDSIVYDDTQQHSEEDVDLRHTKSSIVNNDQWNFKTINWAESKKRKLNASFNLGPKSNLINTPLITPNSSEQTTPAVTFKNFEFLSPSIQPKAPALISRLPSHQPQIAPQESEPMARNNPLPQIYTLPSMNPSSGSLQRFSTFAKSTFQYTPHDYRLRLNTINNGRRRSSILNVGPLPDSLILKVFQYCDLPTLMKVTRVCSRWKQLIYLSNSLVKTLDLTLWCKELDDASLIQITNFVGSRPEIINLTNCYHITDVGFSYLINEIGFSGCIKELKMKNNWNISAMAIMDLSVAGRSILKLDLSNCRKVKDDVIIRLIGKENDFKFGCHYLADLNLGYCKYLTDQSLKFIGENGFRRLKSLDLTRCTTITDYGFLSWLSATECSLERLILRDCTFLTDKVIEVLGLIATNLKVLDLTFCCMLTDVSLKLIGDGLKNLRSLNLSFCGSAVSDYSLYELVNLKELNSVSIKGCIRVTRAGVDMLLTKMVSLSDLTITQCSRVNVYHGQNVAPFEAINGKYCCLKIKPHGRIVKVFV